MPSVWDMILQWGSTIKVSVELPAATSHRHDMTEKLLKATLNPNTHTHKPLVWVRQEGRGIKKKIPGPNRTVEPVRPAMAVHWKSACCLFLGGWTALFIVHLFWEVLIVILKYNISGHELHRLIYQLFLGEIYPVMFSFNIDYRLLGLEALKISCESAGGLFIV